jgi:hypothetical protein
MIESGVFYQVLETDLFDEGAIDRRKKQYEEAHYLFTNKRGLWAIRVAYPKLTLLQNDGKKYNVTDDMDIRNITYVLYDDHYNKPRHRIIYYVVDYRCFNHIIEVDLSYDLNDYTNKLIMRGI